MFYLLKRVDEKQFNPGDKVMLLADFPAVSLRAGTIATVVEIYDGGLMIEWRIDDECERRDGMGNCIGGNHGHSRIEREGFGREELEYLAVQTEKHPKVL